MSFEERVADNTPPSEGAKPPLKALSKLDALSSCFSPVGRAWYCDFRCLWLKMGIVTLPTGLSSYPTGAHPTIKGRFLDWSTVIEVVSETSVKDACK